MLVSNFSRTAAPTGPVVSAPAGELRLLVRSGQQRGQVIRILAPQCSIGSGPGCTLRLQGAQVAALHCWIVTGPTSTLVRRNAANATLNGTSFDEAQLRKGDLLRLAGFELQVLDCVHTPETASSTMAGSAFSTIELTSQPEPAPVFELSEIGPPAAGKVPSVPIQVEAFATNRGKADTREKLGIRRTRRTSHARARKLLGLLRRQREQQTQVTSDLARWQGTAETIQTELSQVREQQAAATTQHAEVAAERNAATLRATQLESERQSVNDRLLRLSEIAAQTETRQYEATQQLLQLKLDHQSLTFQNQSEQQRWQFERAQQEAALSAANQAREALQNQAHSSLTSLQTELAEIRTHFESAQLAWQREREELTQLCRELEQENSSVNTAHKSQQQELSFLQAENVAFKFQLQHEAALRTASEKELADQGSQWKTSLSAATEAQSELQAELANTRLTVAQSATDLAAEKGFRKQESNEFTAVRQRLETELTRLKTEMEQRQADLLAAAGAAGSEAHQLATALESIRLELNQLQSQRSREQEEWTNVRARWDADRNSLVVHLQECEQELTAVRRDGSQQVGQASQVVDLLRTELDQTRERHQQLQAESASKRLELEESFASRSELWLEQKNAAVVARQEAEQERARLAAELAQIKQRLEASESACADQQRAQSLQQAVELQLQTDLSAAQEQAKQQWEQSEASRAEAKAAYEAEQVRCQQELAQLRLELQGATEQAALPESLSEDKQALLDLQGKLSTATQELARAQGEQQLWSSRFQEVAESRAEQAAELAQLQAEVVAGQATIAELQTFLVELQQHLADQPVAHLSAPPASVDVASWSAESVPVEQPAGGVDPFPEPVLDYRSTIAARMIQAASAEPEAEFDWNAERLSLQRGLVNDGNNAFLSPEQSPIYDQPTPAHFDQALQAPAEPAAGVDDDVNSVLGRLMRAGIWKDQVTQDQPEILPSEAPGSADEPSQFVQQPAAYEPEAPAPVEPVVRQEVDSSSSLMDRLRAQMEAAEPEDFRPESAPPVNNLLSRPEERRQPESFPVKKDRKEHGDDEESIDSYMARLLSRMRGESSPEPQSNAQDAAKVVAAAAAYAPQVVSVAPTQPVVAVAETVCQTEYVPRSQAAEQGVGLRAMRELANSAARSALNTHAQRRGGHGAPGSLLLAGASAVVSAALVAFGVYSEAWQAFVVATAFAVVGLFFGLKLVLGMFRQLRLARPRQAPPAVVKQKAEQTVPSQVSVEEEALSEVFVDAEDSPELYPNG